MACKTLMAYVGNAANSPSEEKFRKIRLTNPAFQQRARLGVGRTRTPLACSRGRRGSPSRPRRAATADGGVFAGGRRAQVGSLTGGIKFLETVGFEKDETARAGLAPLSALP